MKKLLIPFFIVFIGFTVNAQQKAAKADYGALEKLVLPNKAEVDAKYERYQDSLKDATYNTPEVQKLIQDAKYIEYADMKKRKRAVEAEMKVRGLTEQLNTMVYEKGEELYGPIYRMNDLIKTVAADNGYDMCFLYGPKGIFDVAYKDPSLKTQLMNSLTDCAKKKSEETGNKNMVALGEECQEELLNPLIDNSVDITQLIIQKLGK